MKINWNTKYTTVSVYTVLTFAACLIVYAILFNFTIVGKIVRTAFSVAAPITWGLVIAYLVNPIMMYAERHIKRVTERKKPHPKLNRIISTAVAMSLFIAIICALIALILPQVLKSITSIFENVGLYIENCRDWVNSLSNKYPELVENANKQISNLEIDVNKFVENLFPKISDLMVKVTDRTFAFVIAIKDFLIGLIVAVYFLYDKEHFQAQLKKFSYAILPEKSATTFFRICSQTNSSINGFIYGKIIDSIIIGFLCFISMTVMKLDFAVLISVIVGITNIIPFFGPFIGAIPSALLLLVASPKQVIPFVILILIIQQLDGNVIGPKILGQSTGVSAFWVLFSILVGGGLFGFAGMILGVPVFAVAYSLIDEFINYRLESKNMSHNTDDYLPPVPHPVKIKKDKPKKK